MATKHKVRYAPIPRMRPGLTTAKAVLEWVYDRIKEEPRRLNMAEWIIYMRGKFQDVTPRLKRLALPECGTVACMGGWINLAVRNDHKGLSGTAARQVLRLPVLGWYGSNYAPALNTPAAIQLSKDLDQLFSQTHIPKSQVLKNLKHLIALHADTLAAIAITVPTAKAVRERSTDNEKGATG